MEAFQKAMPFFSNGMKYFGKPFFRFTLGFLAIVLASLVVIFAVSAYASGVSKIAFTTDEQTILPGDVSDPITVQTQDSSGSSTPTPETIDLQFTSTSNTGEFLNSSGNPVTTTMSKNTSNRTFYYRDSSEGSFTIRVLATGRDSGETWSAEQKITVSSSSSGNTSGEVLSASDATSQSGLSATSGSASPTYGSVSSQLEVSAGGNRLTSPGSPITFQAMIKKNSSSDGSVSFSWSFGDGNVGEGSLSSHMYKYPGEYAVVLNAKSGNIFATSRLKVTVINPNISILDEGDHIKIENNSNSEINLFNWKIVDDGKGFVFQPDTIIFQNSSILLDKSLLKMKGEAEKGLILKNFLGDVVASSDSKEAVDLNYVASKIVDIKTQASAILDNIRNINIASAQNSVSLETRPQPAPQMEESSLSAESLPEQKIIFEAPKEESLVQKIKHFFVSMLD